MSRNAKIALSLAFALANLAACDLAPPTRADLVGRWAVVRGRAADRGAEMELLTDGRVILRGWPGDWLKADPSKRHSASGRWEFDSHHPDRGDPALFLELSTIDNGAAPKAIQPVYWTSFFDTQKLEIGVRDPDEGLPQFEKAR